MENTDRNHKEDLARACGLVTDLRESLTKDRAVSEAVVKAYHEALQPVESAGYRIEEFKVPTYKDAAGRVFAEYALFMGKSGEFLGLIDYKLADPQPEIGFRGQRK